MLNNYFVMDSPQPSTSKAVPPFKKAKYCQIVYLSSDEEDEVFEETYAKPPPIKSSTPKHISSHELLSSNEMSTTFKSHSKTDD